MDYVICGAVVVLLFIAFFLKNAMDDKRKFFSVISDISASFGKKPTKVYDTNEMMYIQKFFERHSTEDSIDDITANDLDIESVYKRMNYCRSSMGSEYLYYRLRTPVYDENLLDKMEKKISHFEKSKEDRVSLLTYYLKIGRMKGMSFYDCLDYFDSVPQKSLWWEYVSYVLIALFIGLIFIKPEVGIVGLITILTINIVNYYSRRGSIEPYIISFGFMVNFINRAKEIQNISCEAISDDLDTVKELTDKLKPLVRNSHIVTGKQVSAVGVGNPLDLFEDYGRMVFHMDIIRFYKMLKIVKENVDIIDSLYIKLGEIESYISIAYFRASLTDGCCVPQNGDVITMKDGYHPLIENPVKNSITAQRGVLITGSNASGKSTFLKTVALNVLCASTLHTCFAESFECPRIHLFSSMSLRDSLQNKDSYFMVEIKAIKRILDYTAAYPDKKVLCFVDEVLRGTNTVERIAAGCEILRGFSGKNVQCFAATHDGELTILLEDVYDNYHFEEDIKENDVLFSYKIEKGRATSRNAIKLLAVMGYDDSIVNNAVNLAGRFVETGEWK